MLLAALALIVVGFLPAHGVAQTKAPFGVQVETGQGAPAATAGFVSRALAWVYARQQAFHRLLTNTVKALRTDPSAIWLLFAASFFYGVFHAAGPGHGKAVLSSYMLANETQLKRGVLLAFAASLVQAMSAVGIVAVLAILLNATSLVIRSTTDFLELASYGFITLVGLWLVYSKARGIVRRNVHSDHVHDHRHEDHGHMHEHNGAGCWHVHMPAPDRLSAPLALRESAGLVLAMGLRPCTGAILVLLFALAQGILLAGVGAAFVMALGTAITVSVLAAMALGAKRLALRLAGGSGHGAVWHQGIELAGAGMVLALGVVLFAATLQGGGSPF